MTCAFEQVQSFLEQLGQTESSEMRLNADGYCFLKDEHDASIMIAALPGTDFFFVKADLLPLAANNSPTILEKLLAMNLYQDKTQGGAIGLDTASNMLVLSYRANAESMDFNAFNNLLDNLVACARKIREEILTGGMFEQFSSHSADTSVVNLLKI